MHTVYAGSLVNTAAKALSSPCWTFARENFTKRTCTRTTRSDLDSRHCPIVSGLCCTARLCCLIASRGTACHTFRAGIGLRFVSWDTWMWTSRRHTCHRTRFIVRFATASHHKGSNKLLSMNIVLRSTVHSWSCTRYPITRHHLVRGGRCRRHRRCRLAGDLPRSKIDHVHASGHQPWDTSEGVLKVSFKKNTTCFHKMFLLINLKDCQSQCTVGESSF